MLGYLSQLSAELSGAPDETAILHKSLDGLRSVLPDLGASAVAFFAQKHQQDVSGGPRASMAMRRGIGSDVTRRARIAQRLAWLPAKQPRLRLKRMVGI